METQMQSHQHECPMKKLRENFNVQSKWSSRVLETKMLPCEAIFQKWHPTTLGNFWASMKTRDWFHYFNQETFCSLLICEDTSSCNFLIIISRSGFMLWWTCISWRNSRPSAGSQMGNILWNVVICSFWIVSIALLLSKTNIYGSQRAQSGTST